MKKPSAVLDTNVLVSGFILPKSNPAQILRLWRQRKFTLITSSVMLKELELTFYYPKLTKYFSHMVKVSRFIFLLQNKSFYLSEIRLPKIAIRDKKDLMVLGTALDSHADYLVTGDKDLLVLKHQKAMGKLSIVTPTQFIGIC
ncbi:MAG: putative toxin-antitoxin system toxin component, PIN family [Candidatus Gottesmanbacteria bacterium]|nr:putative toxin-antitoxin system toxin component, PIN family [Candidatus Gottesmanbacteria bacterium]